LSESLIETAPVTAAPSSVKSPSRAKACSSWPAYIGIWASRARPHNTTIANKWQTLPTARQIEQPNNFRAAIVSARP
jgi:hypothetical protein